jgi:hypothetical protein
MRVKNYFLTSVHNIPLPRCLTYGVELNGEIIQNCDPHIGLSHVVPKN